MEELYFLKKQFSFEKSFALLIWSIDIINNIKKLYSKHFDFNGNKFFNKRKGANKYFNKNSALTKI